VTRTFASQWARHFFILTCALLIPALAHAFNSRDPFDISADLLEYDEVQQTLTADGHVVVVQDTSTLRADHLRYSRSAQRLWAQGHVIVRENGAIAAGDQLDYDLLKQAGTFTQGKGYHAPWLFQGSSWEKELDYYTGRDMSFTSCDLIDPHYHIRSSRIHLVPDERFWAWNNLFYADTLPVFYTPFMYKDLAQRRVVTQWQPGHDDVDGDFVKTMTTVRFNEHVYDKILYDYYSLQGNGFGNELDYQVPNHIKGSIFGYYISPHGTSELSGAPSSQQYNFRAYEWQKLNSTTILQSNVDLRKYVSFNNQFFPEDNNQSITTIPNSVALTRQTKLVNQRLIVQGVQAPDVTDISTYPVTHFQSATLPEYDLSTIQIPIWTPKSAHPGVSSSSSSLTAGTTNYWLNRAPSRPPLGPLYFSANSSLQEEYLRVDDRQHANGNGSFTLNQSIPLSRQWTLTPGFTPSMSWQDKFTPLPPPPVGTTVTVPTLGLFRGFQSRVATSDDLRWRPSTALTFDQIYALTERMEPNGTGLDRSPVDGGVETHHLSWQVFYRPNLYVLWRSFSGFDLRRIADEDPNAYLQRKWDPWTNEWTYKPSRRSHFDYFFRYQLGYYPTRTSLWEADMNYWGRYGTFLTTGFLYNKGQPGVLTWNNRIGLYASPNWRVDATFHAFVPNGGSGNSINLANFIDEQLIVTRDLHCWQVQFIYSNLQNFTRTYSVLASLKMGPALAKPIEDRNLESQFYPWRAYRYAP
jgi:hypothetical protein